MGVQRVLSSAFYSIFGIDLNAAAEALYDGVTSTAFGLASSSAGVVTEIKSFNLLADAHTADRIAMALKTYDSYAPATYSTVASTWRTQARRMTTNFSTRLGYTGLTISSVAFSANVANGRYGAAAVNVADFGMGYLGMSGNSRAMAVSFVYFASRFAFDDGG